MAATMAIKRFLVRFMCQPIFASGLYRWYRGQIPFRGMVIDAVHLVSKRGGKSGGWQRPDDPLAPPEG